MSGVGPRKGVFIMIKIVSCELPKSIFQPQRTITNKVIKLYTGYRSIFLDLEYLCVWNWEPNWVQYTNQKLW